MTTQYKTSELVRSYPELFEGDTPLLTADDLHQIDLSYHQLAHPSIYEEFRKQTIRTIAFGHHSLRALVWDADSAAHTMAVSRHLGSGLGDDAIEFAYVAHTLMPDTNIVVLPGDIIHPRTGSDEDDNLSLSDTEYAAIGKGDSQPYVDRMTAILEQTKLDTTKLHFAGASQGGHISTNVADSLHQSGADVASLTVIERPTELHHHTAHNILALHRSMTHYPLNMQLASLGNSHSIDPSLLRGSGRVVPDGRQIQHITLLNDYLFTHKDTSIPEDIPGVTAYGSRSLLTSPAETLNESQREQIVLQGEYADHSVAMMPLVLTALARHSRQLSATTKSPLTLA